MKVSLDGADCFISILEYLSDSRFYSAALPPNKSMAAAAGSLLFSNLDRSVSSKSWLNRSAPPPRHGRERSPLCQRSLCCQVSFANPKEKPKYAAVSNTQMNYGIWCRIFKNINMQRDAVYNLLCRWQLYHFCHVLFAFFILFSIFASLGCLILRWKAFRVNSRNVHVTLMLIYGNDGDCVTGADVIHLDLI